MGFVHELPQKYLRSAPGFIAGFNEIFRPK
jgi:hypothetical protein